MNNKVLEYFEKIDFYTGEEAEILEEINDAKEDYENKISKAKQDYKNKTTLLQTELSEIKAEHERLNNQIIGVDLNNIIREVSNLWKVSPEKITVNFVTDICQAYVNKPNFYMCNLVNRNFKNGQYDDAFYKYTVTLSHGDKLIKFYSPLQSKAIQSDGKPLLEHANYQMIESENDPYFDLKIDDISVLKMYFKVKNLHNSNNETSQIIINACNETPINPTLN